MHSIHPSTKSTASQSSSILPADCSSGVSTEYLSQASALSGKSDDSSANTSDTGNSAVSKEVMEAREKRYKLMLEAPIIKVIPIIALPMVVTMLIDSFYNLADTYFVSTLGTYATAAVGVNNSLMFFLRAVGMGFGMGASSIISRLLGAKKYDEASRVASTAFYTSLLLITLISIAAYIKRADLVMLLGATGNSRQYSIDYADYILYSAPFTIGNTVLSQCLRAEGSTTYSMVGMVTGCIINLVLDPLFIFVFHWGVAGAAAATGLSKVVSFIILLIPYFRGKSMIQISTRFFAPGWSMYREIGKMGIPSFLRTSLMSVSSVITNNYAGSYGDSVLAAVSVSNRIMMFMGSMVLGFGQGFQPIAGYCWGAKKYRRTRKAFWITSGYGLLICAFMGTLIYTLAPKIVGIFTVDDQKIIEIGVFMVRLQCVVLPAHVWVMIINGLFQALGRPVAATILGLSRQCICLIPLLVVLNAALGLTGLEIAQSTSDVASVILALPMLYMIMREIRQRMHSPEAVD